MSTEFGILRSLDVAIRVLRNTRGWIAKRAADRLQRERDMRHKINQEYGKRQYLKKKEARAK